MAQIPHHDRSPPGANSKCGKARSIPRSFRPSHTGATRFLAGSLVLASFTALGEGNLKKRLVKSPKVYIRDSGLTHSLLGIDGVEALLGHPVFGSSWEAFCIETLIVSFPEWIPSFYRSSGGAEIDLVLERGVHRLAFEFKASSAPNPTRGFHSALADLEPDNAYLVGIMEGSYPISATLTACGILECVELVRKAI